MTAADADLGIDLSFDSSLTCFLEETSEDLSHYFIVEQKIQPGLFYFIWMITLPAHITKDNILIFAPKILGYLRPSAIDCFFSREKGTIHQIKLTAICDGMDNAILIYNKVQKAKKELKIPKQNLTLFKLPKPVIVSDFRLVFANSPSLLIQDALYSNASRFFPKSFIVLKNVNHVLVKTKVGGMKLKTSQDPL